MTICVFGPASLTSFSKAATMLAWVGRCFVSSGQPASLATFLGGEAEVFGEELFEMADVVDRPRQLREGRRLVVRAGR